MHRSPLGLDEVKSGNDGEAMIQPSKKENKIHVDNPIHDGPPPIRGVEVLAVVSPTPSKKDSTHRFVIFK